MRIDATKALIAYAGTTTAAIAYMFLTAAAPAPRHASFDSIDVGRINVREPDGTIRMIISNTADAPGLIIKNREHSHPSRRSAGMIFFNDEGTENGGLIFDGKMVGGKPVGGGSLSFDRYEQDQVVQMLADEDGNERTAGFNVFDRPNTRITFDLLDRVEKLPVNERAAFYERTGLKGRNRVFVGRSADGASSVVLRDAAGRARLVLSVTAGGAARLTFLDPTGKPTRTISG